MTRDFLLCSHCGSRLTVVKTDGGGDEITIKIRTGRKAPEFPLSTNRQAIDNDIKSIINETKPARQDVRAQKVIESHRSRRRRAFEETFAVLEANEWNRSKTCLALNIRHQTLYNRLRDYQAWQWLRKDDNGGWVKTPSPSQDLKG